MESSQKGHAEEVLAEEGEMAVCHQCQREMTGHSKIRTSAFIVSELVDASISVSVFILEDTADVTSAVGGGRSGRAITGSIASGRRSLNL